MQSIDPILIIFTFLIIAGLSILFFFRDQKLSQKNFQKYSQKILHTTSLAPPHAIFESHKCFVAAIGTLISEKRLTSAKKISLMQKRLPNQRAIWKLHNLRNQIAHEPDVRVLKTQAELARREFVRALKSLS